MRGLLLSERGRRSLELDEPSERLPALTFHGVLDIDGTFGPMFAEWTPPVPAPPHCITPAVSDPFAARRDPGSRQPGSATLSAQPMIVRAVFALSLCALSGCGARTATRAVTVADDDAFSSTMIDGGRDASENDAGLDASELDVGHDAPMPTGCTDAARAAFAGTWSGPVNQLATITLSGVTLHGVWLTNMRPPFLGVLATDDAGVCMARVTFPDAATYDATLAPSGCEIDWNNATTWIKSGCP